MHRVSVAVSQRDKQALLTYLYHVYHQLSSNHTDTAIVVLLQVEGCQPVCVL